jgi:hypothetical protein
MQEVGNAIRRSKRTTAGVRRYDESYEWNLMNLSVNMVLQDFGEVADKACKDELKQLFREKKTLVPVKWETLNDKQKRQTVKSHMFLKEKFEDGSFVKLKARLVADGRTQDRSLYSDYSSPTAKTRSVITCLKLAVIKNWDCMKVDIGGAFLCTKIEEHEEVFLQLDRKMTELAVIYMPELEDWV